MSNDDVTIIISAYNNGKYIKRAIESALSQIDICPKILISYDESSEDDTGKICAEYATKYESITLLTTPKCWVGRARNLGAKAATTKYIRFLDGDDQLPPHSTSLLYYKADGKRIVHGDIKIIYPGNKIVMYNGMQDGKEVFGLCGILYDKQFYSDYLQCPEHIRSWEDAQPFLLLPTLCKDARYIPETVYNHIINRGSNTNGNIRQMVNIGNDGFELLKSINSYRDIVSPEEFERMRNFILEHAPANIIFINKLPNIKERVEESKFWVNSMNELYPEWRESALIQRLLHKPIYNKLLRFYVDNNINDDYIKFTKSLKMKLIVIVHNYDSHVYKNKIYYWFHRKV